MKNMFAKMSLMAVLLLGGLMLATNVQAQGGTLQQDPAKPDVKISGTWSVGAAAVQLLDAQLNGPISQALATLPQGGQSYTTWKCKYQFYSAVRTSIIADIPVAKAVRVNYEQFNGSVDAISSPISSNEWQVIFDEMVDLLTF
jgi:hypothetical protein